MMEVFYEDDLITLVQGNCMDPEELAFWTSADVLVTDPPYGVAYVSNSSKYGSTKPIAGDEDAGLRDAALDAWKEANGVTAPALVFGRWDVERPYKTRQRLIWDKGDSPGMGDLTMPWGKGDEEIYVLGLGWQGKRQTNVIRALGYGAASHRRPDHPTPKPVALMEALIEKCPDGVIADPFTGSGATLIAARNLGRKALGVEIDPYYCEIVARRLGQQTFDFGDDTHIGGSYGDPNPESAA